ncbi:MAG: hypothetical protein AAGD32_10840 [Planctomycetota bacterium]
MDIASGMLNLNRVDVMAKVQFAAARKVLDVQKQTGDTAIKLLNAATDGLNAAATGLGKTIDVRA